MPVKRSVSAEKQKKKTKKGSSKSGNDVSNTPPPPPPQVIVISTVADYEAAVLQFSGAVLLSVVTPVCQMCVNTVIPFLTKLNNDRPDVLEKINIVVLVANSQTEDLCQQLSIYTIPYFASYSYGKLVESFSGDNVQKALLIAKIAAQAAKKEEQARVEAEAVAAATLAANDATKQTENIAIDDSVNKIIAAE